MFFFKKKNNIKYTATTSKCVCAHYFQLNVNYFYLTSDLPPLFVVSNGTYDMDLEDLLLS